VQTVTSGGQSLRPHADAGFTYSRYYKRFSERPGERERVKALVDGGVSGLADVLEMTPEA
jgi:hypothetical protein